MIIAQIIAGLITVIGVGAFVGGLIWQLDREDEAFRATLDDTSAAPLTPEELNKLN